MTPVHAILIVIIRLWAATALISFIVALSGLPFLRLGSQENVLAYLVQTYAFAFGWLVVGVAVWILAPKLARLVYRKPGGDNVSILVDADTFVMIGSFLIGGFYLTQYVPQLIVQTVAVLIEMGQREPDTPYGLGQMYVHHFDIEQLFRQAAVVAAASWMAFRPRQIAYIFSRLRRAGLHEKAEQ